ncbi:MULTISPECIES: hypothetical protein [unclassified Mesorhizobium]|uniref:hypothetical protein n=1 Tax=unclassified Mesorhizobium TaxID=325217 RepID=UPI0003CF8E35|nr:hypothetical protein [Mesorhizobium sp. LSJC280B00]ESW68431.1 hypothetical protein X772_34420 [Mesorhizobium sp. LSJC280B00]
MSTNARLSFAAINASRHCCSSSANDIRSKKSDFYLIKIIPDQYELCLLIWLWPDRVVDCEIAYEGSTFEVVGTETIQTHKKTLRGHSAKDFKIIERIALSEHNQL